MSAEFLTLAIGMFTMELALANRVGITTPNHRARYRRICGKALQYLDAITPHAPDYHGRSKALSRLRQAAVNLTPMPDPKAAYLYGHGVVAGETAAARNLTAEIGDLVRHYGRLRPRTDFQFALWYDVIESLGETTGLVGEDDRISGADFSV